MNKILVVADLIEENPIALEQATEMARAYKARLHIVHFCYVDTSNEAEDLAGIQEKVVSNVRTRSERLLQTHIPDDIHYDHDVIWSKHIYDWVNQYAEVEHPIMVIKTGHRTENAFYTPTDWRILRECPAPVLLAPENKWRRGTHVLAAIDLDTRNKDKLNLNQKILNEAERLAAHYDVEMHVCYVPSAPPVLRDLGIKFPDEEETKAKKKFKEEIKRIKTRYALSDEHIHIKAGMADKVIPSTAAQIKASLVVMGMSGRSGLKAKIIGNTAEKVLSLLKTDVLALKA